MAQALKRALSIGAALLLGLALSEGILRVAGWALVESTLRDVRPTSALGPDGRTVLCVGDSNTFGIWVDPAESYPGQLERLLDERAADGPHRVVNVGVPGRSSGRVLAALGDDLDAFEPDILLVLAGFNDRWTWTPPAGAPQGRDDPPWIEELRLTRLLRVVADRARGKDDFSPEGEDPPGPRDRLGRPLDPDNVDYATPVQEDRATAQNLASLTSMVEMARARGVPIVLLTYPAGRDAYGAANEAARRVAADLRVPLIDVRRWFETGTRGREEELFFHDQHPREPGYEVMARLVLNGLIDAELLDARPVEDVGGALVSRPAPPRLRPVVTPEMEPTLVASGGSPGQRIRFLLARPGSGPRAQWAGLELPLADGELFRLTAADPRLEATIDERGEATVSVGHLLVILGGAPLASGEEVEVLGVVETPGGPQATRVLELQVP